MRHESHKTLIGILLAHVNDWRKREAWSRETVVQAIVEAHERSNGPAITEIHFESGHTDHFQRMKNNADRVFRWLDDQTKDNNLLPANFMPSILAAMPQDIRCACANEMLLQAGMGVHCLEGESAEIDVVRMLQSVLKEGGEAQQAITSLLDGATREELLFAQREVSEAIEALQRARTQIEILLTQGT